MGIEALTLYAFSSQNWQRPVDEVAGLMQLLREFLIDERSEILDNQIRLDAIGDIERLPATVTTPLDELRAASAHNTGMTLTIAFNYGGRVEIADAVKKLLADHDAGRLKGEKLGPESIARRLYRPDTPDPDLIIRTSGEERISNFLLWQAAYSELYFTPVLWPDFNREHLYEAIRDFQKRTRRFGGIEEPRD